MRALWVGLEKLDQTLIKGANRWEQLRRRAPYRTRMEKSVEEVRLPQKAIQFDA